MSTIKILPSIMCADLSKLSDSIQELESEGLDTIHIDILDGHFSPSQPIGVETIKKIRQISNIKFDVHIMSTNNEYFVQEMIDIGAESITFHYETSLHVDRLISLINNNGLKAGIALNPATTLSVLDYILPYCDLVLLMLINPGFATHKSEKQVPYALQKVKDLKELITKRELQTNICVDGRVSLDTIPELVRHGATHLVAGSTSLFIPQHTLSENKKTLDQIIQNTLSGM